MMIWKTCQNFIWYRFLDIEEEQQLIYDSDERKAAEKADTIVI